ncbi:MAG: hypothetical protein R2827_03735 [Bdellovibrionales bacterium]
MHLQVKRTPIRWLRPLLAYAIIAVGSVISTSSFAAVRCEDVFSVTSETLSPEVLYSEMELFESNLRQAYMEVNTRFGKNDSVNQEMMDALLACELSGRYEIIQRAILNCPFVIKKLNFIFVELESIRERKSVWSNNEWLSEKI